jgi:hypothetical protein
MAAASSSSSANSSSNNCASIIPKIIKFGYTDFKVLSDAKPPKRTARCKFCTSEKIFINDSINTTSNFVRHIERMHDVRYVKLLILFF